ncbi:MAG: CoA transferase [Myxococcales bacterium]|nr:CoA transferase [Myxococcales bacterium]
MPYATRRFVELGFRVVRVEAPSGAGRGHPGDPNRYIGRPMAGPDRRSYFVAPNAGKEAVVIDLKLQEGQALLRRMVHALGADVFCTNTLPARHAALGLGYETLSRERPELIWCSVSALGPTYPEVPGYDPMLQALCGYMDLTGNPDGPPLLCGVPLIDLKAGDEVFAQVLYALYERTRTGRGKRIDISMAQAAVSWLVTFLPLLDMGSPPDELRRSGNEHRNFLPTNAYPTADGMLYLAVGSDAQWARLVAQPLFRAIADPAVATNEGRRERRSELFRALSAITSAHPTDVVAAALRAAGVPNAPVTPIEGVMELPFVASALLTTTAPDGQTVRLPPPAVATEWLAERHQELAFAPGYGEHTDSVLAEIGVDAGEREDLRRRGVTA